MPFWSTGVDLHRLEQVLDYFQVCLLLDQALVGSPRIYILLIKSRTEVQLQHFSTLCLPIFKAYLVSYVWSVDAVRFCGKHREVLNGSEILFSCKSLVVICMTTIWRRNGIAAFEDGAKPGSVLAAVHIPCFCQIANIGFCNLPQSLWRLHCF